MIVLFAIIILIVSSILFFALRDGLIGMLALLLVFLSVIIIFLIGINNIVSSSEATKLEETRAELVTANEKTPNVEYIELKISEFNDELLKSKQLEEKWEWLFSSSRFSKIEPIFLSTEKIKILS